MNLIDKTIKVANVVSELYAKYYIDHFIYEKNTEKTFEKLIHFRSLFDIYREKIYRNNHALEEFDIESAKDQLQKDIALLQNLNQYLRTEACVQNLIYRLEELMNDLECLCCN